MSAPAVRKPGRPQTPIKTDSPATRQIITELREQRQDAALKFEEMAEVLQGTKDEYSKTTLHRIEAGTLPLSWKHVRAHAVACNVDPELWKERFNRYLYELALEAKVGQEQPAGPIPVVDVAGGKKIRFTVNRRAWVALVALMLSVSLLWGLASQFREDAARVSGSDALIVQGSQGADVVIPHALLDRAVMVTPGVTMGRSAGDPLGTDLEMPVSCVATGLPYPDVQLQGYDAPSAGAPSTENPLAPPADTQTRPRTTATFQLEELPEPGHLSGNARLIAANAALGVPIGSSAALEVYGNGQLLADLTLSASETSYSFDLDLTGVRQLELRAGPVDTACQAVPEGTSESTPTTINLFGLRVSPRR